MKEYIFSEFERFKKDVNDPEFKEGIYLEKIQSGVYSIGIAETAIKKFEDKVRDYLQENRICKYVMITKAGVNVTVADTQSKMAGIKPLSQ